jgi:hypothetical protein
VAEVEGSNGEAANAWLATSDMVRPIQCPAFIERPLWFEPLDR